MVEQIQMYKVNKESFVFERYFHPVYQTKITEADNSVHYDPRKPIEVIEDACLDNGSDFNGRIRSMARILGPKKQYLYPALISEREAILLQPMNSYRNDDCTWINVEHIASDNTRSHYDYNQLHIQLGEGQTFSVRCTTKFLQKMLSNHLLIKSRLLT